MADSKRLLTKKALTVLLETITPGNGYQHDVSGKVWRGRLRPGEESEAPFLILMDVIPEAPDRAEERVQKSTWDIGIKGYVPGDPVHPTDPAENLLADVKKCLATTLDNGGSGAVPAGYLLGGLVADMTIDNGVVFEPDETTSMTYFVMKVSLEFVENIEDPYDVS